MKVGACHETTFNHFDENSDDNFNYSLCRYCRMFITGPVSTSPVCITGSRKKPVNNCALGNGITAL